MIRRFLLFSAKLVVAGSVVAAPAGSTCESSCPPFQTEFMSRADMDGVGSYEQKSTIEPESRGNRVIIANRREPNIYWATSRDSGGVTASILSQSTQQQQQSVAQQAGSSSSYLPSCFCSSLFCGLCTSQEPAGAEKSRLKQQRRASEHSGQTLSYSSSAGASYPTFDFGPFPSNVWKTSKYTLVNFLFKNLFEQFRRMANFYFLVSAIVQIAIPYSPIGPATSLFPLAFVVGTTAIKQAYEDYLRHKLDNEVNHRICCVLREDKQLVKVRSKDIRVGDIVYVKNNEEIPCDMILLASSGNGDRCYVTTANLDGETSLKNRTCFQIHQQVGDIDQINDTMLVIECEKPNATLYEFNGYLRAPKDQAAYESLMKDIKHLDEFRDPNNSSINNSNQNKQRASSLGSLGTDYKRLSMISTIFKRIKVASFNSKMSKHLSANQLRTIGANTLVENNSQRHIDIPLDMSNLLLRASRLRNTSFVYGLAVYTGPDTRLAYNSHVKPNKFSSLESRVNKFLGIAFTLLLVLTLTSALKHNKDEANPSGTNIVATVRANSFIQLFMAYFVLYNYLVPISLYVTLEFVKFLGTISVLEDKKLQGQVTSISSSLSADVSASNTKSNLMSDSEQQSKQQEKKAKKEAVEQQLQLVRPQCNTSDLNEDLGQVEVLFSDKTGTLTENKMHFMACSIQGHLYRAVAGQIYEQPEGLCYMPQLNVARKLSRISSNRYAALAAELAANASPRSVGGAFSTGGSGGPKSASRSSRSSSERMARLPAHQRPFDHRHVPPMREFRPIESLEQHNRLSEFLLCLCLCSTVTLNEQTPLEECLPRANGDPGEPMKYDYQSASPDEESLITAAASFGVVVCKASERECFVAIRRPPVMGKHPAEEFQPAGKQFKPLVETKRSNDKYLVRHFERLITFEFNSVRKKMSVLYRDCDNDCVVMFTKGSESVLDCIETPADDIGGGARSPSSPSSPSSLRSKSPGQTRPPTTWAVGRDHERIINVTLGHFEAFSKSGLRTMLAALRVVTPQEYEKLNGELREARLLPMQDARELRMTQLYRSVESRMSLIGATAVEDSLQDGVPETIAQLKEAGIKVWLLTGDKVETAISVAYLCKLLDRNMNLLQLVRQQDSKSCKDLLTTYVNVIKTALLYGEDEEQDPGVLIPVPSRTRSSLSKRPQPQSQKYNQSQSGRGNQLRHQDSSGSLRQQSSVLSRTSSLSNYKINKQLSTLATNEMDMPRFAMIADGRSLHYAMKYAKEELEFVVTRCVCVLGCRLSPLQKAEIVDMIKESADEPITAAIGDGANDVSMIQEAHVGIGISGKEGRQAVNSSDFAINRFHMISRLFFVHGHLFYHRTANTVHYFFYKNLLFIIPQFLYSFYNLSSATSLYHPIMMIAFNMLLTSFPILFFGLFEINIPMLLLETYPRFYRINNRNKKMSYTTFLTWLIMGGLQALIAFYIIQFIWDSPEPIVDANKMTSPMYFSSILFTSLIYCITIKLYLISRNPSCSFHCASVFSVLILPVTLYVFSLFDLSKLFKDSSLYQQYAPLVRSPTYWLAIATTTAAMVVPDILEYIKRQVVYYRMINSVIN